MPQRSDIHATFSPQTLFSLGRNGKNHNRPPRQIARCADGPPARTFITVPETLAPLRKFPTNIKPGQTRENGPIPSPQKPRPLVACAATGHGDALPALPRPFPQNPNFHPRFCESPNSAYISP